MGEIHMLKPAEKDAPIIQVQSENAKQSQKTGCMLSWLNRLQQVLEFQQILSTIIKTNWQQFSKPLYTGLRKEESIWECRLKLLPP